MATLEEVIPQVVEAVDTPAAAEAVGDQAEIMLAVPEVAVVPTIQELRKPIQQE